MNEGFYFKLRVVYFQEILRGKKNYYSFRDSWGSGKRHAPMFMGTLINFCIPSMKEVDNGEKNRGDNN